MTNKNKPGFYPVYCCNKFLIEAPANTSVYCPKCSRWQNVTGKKGDKLEGDQECLKQSLI